MHNDHNHAKKALEVLKAALEKKRFLLSQAFIELGPDEVRSYLSSFSVNSYSKAEWKAVFDFLIDEGVLRQCVLKYLPFFIDLMAEQGPGALRKVFQIQSSRYDKKFEEIVDLIGISHGALYAYVEKNREEFARRIMSGKTRTLRCELHLEGRRYDHFWGEILDMLVNAVCENTTEERTYDQGIRAFSMIMNGLREHRSLRSYGKMWEFTAKV